MKITSAWAIMFTAACIVAAASTDGFALRCREGRGIISEGDSKGKVLIECGRPDNKIDASSPHYSPENNTMALETERWYYNCGESSFVYVLEFTSDRLTNIRTAGRGSGRNRCE
jgi:hypothetical protein